MNSEFPNISHPLPYPHAFQCVRQFRDQHPISSFRHPLVTFICFELLEQNSGLISHLRSHMVLKSRSRRPGRVGYISKLKAMNAEAHFLDVRRNNLNSLIICLHLPVILATIFVTPGYAVFSPSLLCVVIPWA